MEQHYPSPTGNTVVSPLEQTTGLESRLVLVVPQFGAVLVFELSRGAEQVNLVSNLAGVSTGGPM